MLTAQMTWPFPPPGNTNTERLHQSTQTEHRVLAQQALEVLRSVAPVTMAAFFPIENVAQVLQ